MPTSSEGPLGLALPNLFLVAVLSWGIFGVNSGLRSPKAGTALPGSPVSSEAGPVNSFPSRHWEDPLIALPSDEKKEEVQPIDQLKRGDPLFESSILWAKASAESEGTREMVWAGILKHSSWLFRPRSQDEEARTLVQKQIESFDRNIPLRYLIVGLDGSIGMSATERRVRKRTAITASILQSGEWREKYSGKLQRFDFRVPAPVISEKTESAQSKNFALTVQCFVKNAWKRNDRFRSQNELVVVYLDENQILENPAHYLSGLYCALASGFSELTADQIPPRSLGEFFEIAKSLTEKKMSKVAFNYVGFNESEKLTKLFQSYHQQNGKSKSAELSDYESLLSRFRIISPSSTVTARELEKRLGWTQSLSAAEVPKIEGVSPGLNLKIFYPNRLDHDRSPLLVHRLSTPDNLMARLLKKELSTRGLRWNGNDQKAENSPNRIMLLSGISSLYSQVQANEIARATNARVDIFEYLRGLDGVSKIPPKKVETPERGTSTVRAEGTSQFDYLERLVGEIREVEKRVQAEEKGWRYDAFGVIGVDAHDRLLILDALQQSFPDRLFFTFGVDARFWQMGSHRRKNNLLMFSSYSLDPVPRLPTHGRDQMSKRFPPFRDDTQTATYDAVQFCLLETTRKKDDGTHEVSVGDPTGYIHEVTRHGISLLDKCYWRSPLGKSGTEGTWIWQKRWGEETTLGLVGASMEIRPRNKLTKPETAAILAILLTLVLALLFRPVVQIYAQLREVALRHSRRVRAGSSGEEVPLLRRHNPPRIILRGVRETVRSYLKFQRKSTSNGKELYRVSFKRWRRNIGNHLGDTIRGRNRFARRIRLHFFFLVSFLIVLALIVFQIVVLSTGLPEGEESISFFSGISSWPSTLLLGCSGLVYLYWIWLVSFNIRKNILVNLSSFPFPECSRWLKRIFNQDEESKGNPNDLPKSGKLMVDGLPVCPNHHLFCGRMARYIEAGRLRRRFSICVVGSLLTAIAFYLVYSFSLGSTTPQLGIRGEFSKDWFDIMKGISMGTLLILLAYVAHSHLLFYCVCNSLLKTLRIKKWRSPSRADDHIRNNEISDEESPHFRDNYLMGPINPVNRIDLPQAVKDYVDGDGKYERVPTKKGEYEIRGPGFWETPVIEFGVNRYRCLNRLLFFPFLALFWQLAVQNSIFDNFHIAQFEIIFYTLTFLFLILVSVLMQSQSRKCVNEAISRVTFVKTALLGLEDDEIGDFLDSELSRLGDCRNAVNHSLLSSPLLRAIALPLGGTGLLQGMEYFSHFMAR